MNTTREPKLLPCPCCGSEAAIRQWRDTENPNATWVECQCGLMTDSVHNEDSREAANLAAAIWNRRTTK